MKYLILLVICGSLALEAHGVRVRAFLQDSENDGFKEVLETSARRTIKVKKRFEKQNPQVDSGGRWDIEAPKKERSFEYEQSVDKILEAVKKIITKGVPLLYPKTVGCGNGIALKCQYTPNKTEDERFFGYHDKPHKLMVRIMDYIDKLVSHPILRTYVEMLDYSGSSESVENDEKARPGAKEFDIKKMKLGKILMFVQRIVHREQGEAPQNFVCGIQMDKEKSYCKYYERGTPVNSIVGFRFDAAAINDAVMSVFTSREIMKGFIKIANDVASIFPAFKTGRKRPGSDNARLKNVGLSTAQRNF